MLTPNTVIQNYRLVRKLGEGGMGEVWLAEHSTINRKVAIKVLHAQYARNPKIQQRFRNEAATLSKLKHPNIVALYDFIESDADIYLVMEYVEGRNLEEVVRTDTGPMPTKMLLQIFQQILSAVGYAHQQGVVHRDIKPSNFMIDAHGAVKVLDFGIAKLLEDDQHLTKTGLRMGTTFYMSPEQVNTEAVDHRSDIYSLGVTLFFLATGKAPYEGETSEYKVFDQIVRTPLPAGRTVYVGVAPEVDAVIAKATKKAPADRFQACGEFLEAVNKKQEKAKQMPRDPQRKKWTRILFERAVLIVGLLFIAIPLLLHSFEAAEENTTSMPERRNNDSALIDSVLASTFEGILDNPQDLGIPDSDGDGLHDGMDSCDQDVGFDRNCGCPDVDLDKDGVFDFSDECPYTPGLVENRGCPKASKSNEEAMELLGLSHHAWSAYISLSWEDDYNNLLLKPKMRLKKLADRMNDAGPSFRLYIVAFHDKRQNKQADLEMARKRVQSVKNFLSKCGLPPRHISTVVYEKIGCIRPVEMSVVLE
jgi:serine/threonine protein kinase